ncbi:hypothetical protein P3F56_02690 [cyanobacterium endosymbiont of Epithemia clementina EcSB]|nr:hypothetical protein [cyanobacterium endosymbiont of Epithemia clementina EcSB]WGT68006.1 hypothetical protein P3F56_02690 [cyanobacterium endosymbiont of Epithemia clementina EcSB]
MSLQNFISAEEMGREIALMSVFPVQDFLSPPFAPEKLFSMVRSLTCLWTGYF